MRFSVIIPMYKAKNTILLCIQGLLNQTFSDFEVICVDSSPDQKSEEIIKTNSTYKTIHLSTKTLSEKARNQAAMEAKGEVLAFIDADCIPKKDWLERINQSFLDGNLAVNGPIKCYNLNYVSILAHISKFWLWLEGSSNKYSHLAATANFAIDKELFYKIGGFTESHLSSADSSFCYYLNENNVRIFYNPEVIVHHIHKTTVKSLFSERFVRGKEFGIMRTQLKTWNKLKSLVFLFVLFLLPLKNFFLKWMVCIKSRYGLSFLSAAPIHFLLECAWMGGQSVAHLKNIFKRD